MVNLFLVKFLFLFCFYFYLRDLETHTEIAIHRDVFHCLVYTLKCLRQPDMDQAKARSSELKLIFPFGWQKPNYLRHHLLPPRVCVSRKLEYKIELGIKPRHSYLGCRCPRQCLSGYAKCLLLLLFCGTSILVSISYYSVGFSEFICILIINPPLNE